MSTHSEPAHRLARPGRAAALRQITLASRPISWINTAFPFAAAHLLTTRRVDLVLVVASFYFLIPYNLALYGINDVFDHESDLANPRKGGIEGALLAPALHRTTLWAAVVTNLPFLVFLVAVGRPAVWVALAVSIGALIAYSAPGLRFKERPVLDSMTSATHFVSPAVVGLALAGGRPSPGVGLTLVAFFCWGMAAQAFGAVQDIVPDRAAGIASVATALGAGRTVRLALGLWTLAGLVMLLTPWPGPLGALLVVPYLVNAAPYRRVDESSSASTNRAWRRFIALNYLAGFLATMVLVMAWFVG